jgi:guanine deaminase
MMDYQTAIRGAFFDIAQVCDSAEAIPRHARYLDDGLLFIHNGNSGAMLAGGRAIP